MFAIANSQLGLAPSQPRKGLLFRSEKLREKEGATMTKKRLRYRVGIDVGLYSVGLAAIEIDDSDNNPLNAMPIKILSCMSVIHDGAIDPDSNKTADSRKAISGVARRVRRLRSNRRKRLNSLDRTLGSLGYPLAQAEAAVSGLKGSDPYLPWRARIAATREYIENEYERRFAITVAVRHIARHRGWRNPYSSTSSLKTAASAASQFYIEFFKRVESWKYRNGLPLFEGTSISATEKNELVIAHEDWLAERQGIKRPTPAEIIEPLLKPDPMRRIRAERPLKELKNPEIGWQEDNIERIALDPDAQMGKLHQSDNYYELRRIFTMQQVPESEQDRLFAAVFAQINPREKGAAAELVAKDDLQPQRRRTTKASLAFQRYRILTTIANLRIREKDEKERPLTLDELHKIYGYLTSKEIAAQGGTTWSDVAECLGIERSELRGVGGTTQDGEPISAKNPPYLSSESAILNAEGIKKELAPIADWWNKATEPEKEWFIDFLGNAGLPSKNLSSEEIAASDSVNELLNDLDELALEKLEKIKLASGRAAYSADTMSKLNSRMLNEGLDLHAARKIEFGVDDDWHPSPEPLGTPTGNPAVDRTIKIVSRWLTACDKRWGRPETINLEHVREGFVSEKQARTMQSDMNKRYQANIKVKKDIIEALNEGLGSGSVGLEALRNADVRRWQAVQRQNCQCLYCGAMINFNTAQMDHIVPRKGVGSTNTLPNLVATCASCNKDKSNRLYYHWATPERRQEALARVDSWNRDSYFTSNKQFGNYKKEVKARLLQKDEDEPIDARSIESVAWMARQLKEQIAGYFGYSGSVTDSTSGNEDFSLQRVNVFRGWITSEARKASGLENALPWIGGASEKTRLDRRHHAIDAAVIAMMRPAVAKVLVEREALKREQRERDHTKEQVEALGPRLWRNYRGSAEDSPIYEHWCDDQMSYLSGLLAEAMQEDEIIVTNPIRLRLGRGRAHEDTVRPLIRRKVGDSLTPINIDKAETPALWLALTNHPDYDLKLGLPADSNRRIRIHDRWLDANDKIGFMADGEKEFNVVKDAVYTKVRGGFAAIGATIHHARLYRIPKMNKSGHQTGWTFAHMRVFQEDLVRHHGANLFNVDIPAQAISRRSAVADLRAALNEGTAEYLGWLVVGDEITIDPNNEYFNPEGKNAVNKFLKAFPGTKRFRIIGFPVASKLSLAPILFASEGLPDVFESETDNEDIRKRKHKARRITYGNNAWTDDDIVAINKLLGIGASWTPSVDSLFSTYPTIIRRNTLGQIRWQSNNNMPVSWKVAPHPQI